MKEHNTILDATMTTLKQASEYSDKWYVLYQIEKRLTAEAYKAGVKICTGTDDNQQKFMQYEMGLLVNEAGF
jgi:imidazolonepropionase-like amidohydrolase